MGIAKLYSQSGSGGKINGIIEDYYVYAGEKISAGDFVEFINGVAGQTTETSVDTVIDNTTANTTEGLSAVSLDEETAFIAYSATGSRYLYGVVCKIEGAKVIAGKITLLNAVTNSGRMISAVALDSSRVFIAHSSGGMLVAAVCSIEGLEVIYNTQVTLDSTSDASTAISASKLDDNKVFVAHTYSGKYYLYGIVCTINGIQIAPGSNTAVVNSISEAGIRVSTVTLNSSKVFMAHSYGATHFLYGIVCTISGTAITKGTDTKLKESSSAADRVSACTLDESKVFVAYYGGDYALNKIICTISNTTITPDTALSINTSEYCSNVISSMRLPDGNAVVFHSLGEDYKLGATVYNVEGEYVFQYILNSNPYTGSKISSVLLNNDAFVAHSNTSSYYLNAQLFGLEAGVPQTSMTVTQYETQVRKTTTSDIYGVAKTSGMGAYKVVDYTIPEGEDVSKGESIEYSVENIVNGDIIPKTWTKISDTEYQADGITLKANSSYSTYHLKYACDGDASEDRYYHSLRTGSGDWIMWVFPEKKKITKMKLKFYVINYGVGTTYIQGSNNEIDWVNLYTTSSNLDEFTEIPLDNTDWYTHYRILVEATQDIIVYEWQVSEYVGSIIEYQGTALQSGTAGDTIQITVPLTDEESTGHNDKVGVYTALYEYRTFTTDAVPKTWTVVTEGTSYVSSNGTKLTASECHPYSSSADTDYSVSYVCDGDVSKRWQTSSTSAPCWVQLEFPKPIKITKMKTYVDSFYDIKSCVIQGSNDGVNWVDLYTLSSAQTALTEITLTITMEAKYYRIYATKSSHNTTPWIYEWQVSEWIGLVEKQKGGV